MYPEEIVPFAEVLVSPNRTCAARGNASSPADMKHAILGYLDNYSFLSYLA